MVFAVWAARSRSPRASSSSRTRSSPPCGSRASGARAARARGERALRLPAGFLARYFEKLRYSFGPRERAGLYTFLELARDAGELARVPELRFVRDGGRRVTVTEPYGSPASTVVATRRHVDDVLEKALEGERISDDDAVALLRLARPRRGRPRGERDPQPR